MTVQENNKLIVEFMGYENIGIYNHPMYTFYDNYFKDGNRSVEDLCYHTSWDWLKPVVVEIEQVHEGVPQELIHLSLFSTIDEVYNAVVEFINQYNKNK